MIFYQGAKRNHWSFECFSKSPFAKVFSHLTRGLEQFAESTDIPWNQPTIFHPCQIATVPQKFLPQLCVPLSQQYHLFLNGEAQMYNDSKIILDMLCKFQVIDSINDFSAFPTARETLVHSFPSPEKIWFHTGMIVSIEAPNLVPRLHISDCFEIQIFQ